MQPILVTAIALQQSLVNVNDKVGSSQRDEIDKKLKMRIVFVTQSPQS